MIWDIWSKWEGKKAKEGFKDTIGQTDGASIQKRLKESRKIDREGKNGCRDFSKKKNKHRSEKVQKKPP